MLLIPYLNGAIRMLRRGLRDRARTSTPAVVAGAEPPDGPADAARLHRPGHGDVTWRTCCTTSSRTRSYAPPTLLKRMVAAGRLGRKSGRGFYDYAKAGCARGPGDRPARPPAHRRVARAVDRAAPRPRPRRTSGRRSNARRIEEVAEEYASRDLLGVVLDWDDETVTGRGWMGNDWLAALSERFPGVLMGFGCVDPHKPDALDELDRCADLGLKGLKFHPTMQAFDPGRRALLPDLGAGRGARADRAVPHRDVRDRGRDAGRGRDEDPLLAPGVPGRGRRRLPRADADRGALRVAVVHGDAWRSRCTSRTCSSSCRAGRPGTCRRR